ncbi:MAG: isoleucine--tRNA ligase [Alphaproteobacteria bacterium]|nr:isoleucine--tRNA ligase [Alphaproteobacteria bacterium]MBO4644426.1 isoleucine--tRNA ligase [Alphaproteobacteria bacterium]
MSEKTKYYPEVSPKADFPALEEDILKMWRDNGTFKKSVNNRAAGEKGSNEYVFYDGPPFANGLPHYGHLVTGYVKDIIPRYQTMRGHRVERRFGWDCHGLPAEMDTEKFLGISGRAAISKFGIGKFNETCKERVLMYTNEWEQTVTRQARWVAFDNDYKTMDLPYMESIIWAFKELYKKGLMYEGVRILPYSWAAETPVSNFETRMDNSYREREDPSVTVMFTLNPVEGETKPVKVLAWTTTPWTLPSNLALCVNKAIDYDIYEEDGVQYVIAQALAGKYKRELAKAEKVRTVKGAELVGRTYQPLFDYFAGTPRCFQIIEADYVSTEDGTGIVHIAPGFGEDDMIACQPYNIPVICPVDGKGCFTKEVPDYEGLQVFEANEPIIKRLKAEGKLVRKEMYKHNYPHCWRTDTPLIYKAINSWFVKVTEFRDRMVKNNQTINWIPEHVKNGAMGMWLEGARDWSISRNRFWGTPIPVWKSDDPKYPRVDVYGSIAELEKDFGVKVTDLHRPFIDTLVRPNPDDPTGKSMMRRVEDVLDCWFESGSMPFAQVHYPFENKEWFENHSPADFIVEYLAQTRGWFYTLMVMSTALFDRAPFKTCLCHGVVLDENQQKLSKRLRNYPDPTDVFNTLGSDALRWFLVSSPILRGGNLSIDREGKEIAKSSRKALIPLWNAFYFFTLYANAEGLKAKFTTTAKDVLDRYILAKTRELVKGLTEKLDACDIVAACADVSDFLELMNNWYIRRSRARFWDISNGQEAFDVLYTVLVTLTKAIAPLMPLTCEYVYRALTGEESVHLTDYPDYTVFTAEDKLVSDMDFVRAVCSTAKSIREDHKLRNRLPLASMTVAGNNAGRLADYIELIKDEVNVKDVAFGKDVSDLADQTLYIITPLVGKRLGRFMKDILAASKTTEWSKNADGTLSIAGQTLLPEEFELRLVLKDGNAGQALPDNTAVVVLDVTLRPELEREGIARDFVRVIQQKRKDSGFDVSDRIKVVYASGNQTVLDALAENKGYISEQVLAVSFEKQADVAGDTEDIGDAKVTFKIEKA